MTTTGTGMTESEDSPGATPQAEGVTRRYLANDALHLRVTSVFFLKRAFCGSGTNRKIFIRLYCPVAT